MSTHAAPAGREAATARRRCPRTPFSVPITLRRWTEGDLRTMRGITLDIAEGGLGALVQGSLTVGETVRIDLRRPDLRLSTVAIVRHTSSVRSGFEFLDLTAEERRQVAAEVGSGARGREFFHA
jgi:c-di-GMP-binding flagellar brake protein YcgR